MTSARFWVFNLTRFKLESGNDIRVRILTQLTRVTRLELQALIERYRSFKPWPFSQHLKYMKLSKLMGQFQTGEARHALTINHPIIKDELFSLSLFTSGMAQREMDLLGPPRSRLQRLSRLQTGLPRHKGLRGW